MAGVSLFPDIASKVAKKYWAHTKVHADTSPEAFELMYEDILSVVRPSRGDSLLDVGCGTGEITNLFHRQGFNVRGFDSSTEKISSAKKRFEARIFYVDDLINMGHKAKMFDKIFMYTVFYYVHPTLWPMALANLHDITLPNGAVYLLANPDFQKRIKYRSAIMNFLVMFFFPVYNAENAAFLIKMSKIKKAALIAGFRRVEIVDSSDRARSHYILFKQ